MLDVQSFKDNRNIIISEAGIKDFKLSVFFTSKKFDNFHTIATFSMSNKLSLIQKGTHMSRFIEFLHSYNQTIDLDHLDLFMEKLLGLFSSFKVYVKIQFPFFIKKLSPVSKKLNFMDYKLILNLSFNKKKKLDQKMKLIIPISTLCPCSKLISKYGAHNQRSQVELSLKFEKMFDFISLTSEIEKLSSSPLYSLLKREDEKYVTEKAYENPFFVEDVVRNVYQFVLDKNINLLKVKCESFESIHNHNAYALIRV